MNISGCNAFHCQVSMHKAFCSEALEKRGSSLSGESLPVKACPRDNISISEDARAMHLKGSNQSGQRYALPDSSLEKLEENEEFLHEGHDHSHDDEEDDHGGINSQVASKKDLSKEELKELRDLQSRDRQVRNHEQAHIAASGQIATSGPHYEYEKGPDGRRYAVGGSVNYQVPSASSPEEELRLAQQLRRMAMAPMDPSPKDRATAAKASVKEARASQEIRAERAEESSAEESPSEGEGPGTLSKPSTDLTDEPSQVYQKESTRPPSYPGPAQKYGGQVEQFPGQYLSAMA